jgi:hypothetical protein
VGLYYESLCPYCSSFIVNHLAKLFEDDLISIVDLHLSPWGNTKLRSDNVTAVCLSLSLTTKLPWRQIRARIHRSWRQRQDILFTRSQIHQHTSFS